MLLEMVRCSFCATVCALRHIMHGHVITPLLHISDFCHITDTIKRALVHTSDHCHITDTIKRHAGTTTATVLTRAILSEGCKSVAAGMNPMDLRRGINLAVEHVLADLKGRAKMISTTEEIAQVFSATNHPAILNTTTKQPQQQSKSSSLHSKLA